MPSWFVGFVYIYIYKRTESIKLQTHIRTDAKITGAICYRGEVRIQCVRDETEGIL